MKKSIIAVTLALFLLLFGGCSCNQMPTLSFNNGWAKDGDADKQVVGTTERAVYTVTYSPKFSSSDSYVYNKASSLDGVLDLDIQGSYAYEIEVIDQTNLPDIAKQSELVANNSTAEKPQVIRLSSEYNVNAIYTINGKKSDTYNDVIVTESYFFRTDLSLAPIYSITKYKSSTVGVIVEDDILTPKVEVQKYVKSIIYNNSSYTIKTFDFDTFNAQAQPTQSVDYEYTYRTVIDNSALLFAIRNIEVAKDAVKTLPVVSFTYGNYSSLRFTKYDDSKDEMSISVNGNAKESLNLSVDRIAFGIDANNTGREQLVYIQNSAVENKLKDKALMTKYVQSLTEYSGSYLCMGVVEYTLSEIEYSYPN